MAKIPVQLGFFSLLNLIKMINKYTQLGPLKDVRSRIRNPKGHHHSAIQILLIIGLSLSTVCLGMRLHMKHHLCKNLAMEDRKSPTVISELTCKQ